MLAIARTCVRKRQRTKEKDKERGKPQLGRWAFYWEGVFGAAQNVGRFWCRHPARLLWASGGHPRGQSRLIWVRQGPWPWVPYLCRAGPCRRTRLLLLLPECHRHLLLPPPPPPPRRRRKSADVAWASRQLSGQTADWARAGCPVAGRRARALPCALCPTTALSTRGRIFFIRADVRVGEHVGHRVVGIEVAQSFEGLQGECAVALVLHVEVEDQHLGARHELHLDGVLSGGLQLLRDLEDPPKAADVRKDGLGVVRAPGLQVHRGRILQNWTAIDLAFCRKFD
eukprot:scaffold5953_cov107-Isochrysis_galbana.AAC.5